MHLALQGTTRQFTPSLRQCSHGTGGCRHRGWLNMFNAVSCLFLLGSSFLTRSGGSGWVEDTCLTTRINAALNRFVEWRFQVSCNRVA